MSMPIYLRIEGERQGLITKGASTKASIGNLWQEGVEDWTQVLCGEHHMAMERYDWLKNFPKPEEKGHQPLKILKRIDKSTPLLANAFARGETLKECLLKFYRYTGNGSLENYYTITLRGARVVDIQSDFAVNDGNPMGTEWVSFAYNRIEHRHNAAGTYSAWGWDDSVYTLGQPKSQPKETLPPTVVSKPEPTTPTVPEKSYGMSHASFLKFSSPAKETQKTAEKTIRIGVFFDGTGNDAYNTMLRKAYEADPSRYPNIKKFIGTGSSYDNSFTNIYRLYDIYPYLPEQGVYSHYIEGIGPEKGQADDSLTEATGWDIGNDTTGKYSTGRGVVNRVVQAILAIEKIVNKHTQPWNKLIIDIFGFSRGAAAARHFANEIYKKEAGEFYKKLKIDQQKVQINFMGLFDTVAAMANPGDAMNVTDDINYGVNLYLPDDIANKVFQLTAMDEHRVNFALDRVVPGHEELAVFGCHSDVGGGYRPGPENVLVYAGDTAIIAAEGVESQAKQEVMKTYGQYISNADQLQIKETTPDAQKINTGYTHYQIVMHRKQVEGSLQLVTAHLMREVAKAHHVPFKKELPDPIPNAFLQKVYHAYLDAWRNKQKIAGVDRDTATTLYHNYIHCSDNLVASQAGLVHVNAPAPDRKRRTFPNKPQKGYTFTLADDPTADDLDHVLQAINAMSKHPELI